MSRMRKRVRAWLLAGALGVSVTLGGCQVRGEVQERGDGALSHTESVSPVTARQLAEGMLQAAPEGALAVRWVEEEELLEVLPDIYYVDRDQVAQGACVRLEGAQAFELVVLQAADEGQAAELCAGLEEYRFRREGDFTGYEPEQAQLVHGGTVHTCGGWVALIITQDVQGVVDAMEAGLSGAASQDGGGVGSAPAPSGQTAATPAETPTPGDSPAPQSTAVPWANWTPYVDPNVEDMTIYDTSAIVAAWSSGGEEGLSAQDREILQRCRAILGQIIREDMGELERERAIYRWVVTNISYDEAHFEWMGKVSPHSFTPYGPLIAGKGVCLGFATTFQLLCELSGVECITVVGAAYRSLDDHAWNMVRLNGAWYCADPTWDEGQSDPENWIYFNVTSEFMAQHEHQWAYESVPFATATDGGRN